MKKIGLNIICNNEAPAIGRLLESVRSVVDVIVTIDLGGTDETVSILRKFGFLSGIPVFIYKQPFDNFCNSRNYALEKMHEVARELSWQPMQVWALAIDCDETVQVSDKFDKEQLSADLYLLEARCGPKRFLKQALFKLSVDNPLSTMTLPSLRITVPKKKDSGKAGQENKPWKDVQPSFLLAFNENMQQAESLAPIIRHYMKTKQWNLAHVYSSFAYDTYHTKPPELDPSGIPINQSLYEWKLLFYHYVCCRHTRRQREVKRLRNQLISIFLGRYF